MGVFSKETLQYGVVLYGRYQIMEVIFMAGYKIEYKAKDMRLEKYVIVTEYFPYSIVNRDTKGYVQLCSSSRQKEFVFGMKDFSWRTRRLMDLNDVPGTLDVMDLFEENNTVYVVTEILNGEILSQYMREYDVEKETFAVHIAGSVLETLREIHAHGMLHMNVSPQNVFVCKNLNIKLLEVSYKSINDTRDERTICCVCNPSFAAPEEYESRANVGTWTDIYSLGALLYWLVTGYVLEESISRMNGEEPMKEPKDINPDISQELSDIIMRAIELNPRDRFQNTDEFVRALSGEKIKTRKKKMLFRRRG